MAVSDTTLREVIGRHLNLHLVAGQNLDVVHAHLAGDMGNNLMPVLQFDAEHGVTERFGDGSVKLYGCLFCHSLPFVVITDYCFR